MPELTVISWRDIPAQVTAGKGRGARPRAALERFQEAIDAAAMRAGLIGTDAYLEEWRREARACGDDLDAEVAAAAAQLEADLQRRAARPARPRERRGGAGVTETVLSSATKEVVIGFDRPFVVIGERINPTGRKQLAAEMKAGNFDTVIADALAQVAAGAQMLDVNAGIPLADEPAILRHTVELVQSITDVPLSIDSSIVEALEAGPLGLPGQGARQLGHRRGRADGARAAARREARCGGRRDLERRDRHLARTRTSGSPWHRRSSRAPRITGSRRRTSSSTRS